MADKKQKSEPEFIRGTVLASILLLLIFIAAGVVFARNPDAVRGAAVRTLSSLGNFSAAAEYLKLTFSKSIEPSFTSYTGAAGSASAGCSRSTSQIRTKDS